MVFTYSKLSAFQKCPGSYKFAEDGATPINSSHMNVGKLFHTFAALYGKHCVDSKRLTDTSMVPKIMQDAIKQVDMESAREGNTYCTVEEQEEALAIAEQWSEGAIFEPSLMYWHNIQVKEVISIGDIDSLEGAECLALIATLNRVEGHPDNLALATVTIYKSGWKIETDPMQAEFYALVLMLHENNIDRVNINFDFVRYGIVKSLEYTRDDLPALFEKFRDLVEQANNATEFPCRPGAHCMTCNYAHNCAAKATPIGAIASPDEARSAVENISLMERDLAMAKAALREYTDIYGPVTHNGVKWGTHVSESRGFRDLQAFLKAAACLGEDPFQYLTINQVKAKKLFKKLPDLVTTTRKTAFRGKTAQEGDEK